MLELIAVAANRIQLETGRAAIALNGKLPVASWKQYQNRIASNLELETMFNDPACNGVGMIQGGGYCVLDIDSHQLAEKFSKEYELLWTTYRVKTRRGYHLHFKYDPSQLDIRTEHLNGADIIAAGGYVVMPPSDGYTLERDEYRITLSPGALKVIQRFFSSNDPEPPRNDGLQQARAHLADNVRNEVTEKLEELYKKLRADGRNNALYSTARYAIDNGLDQGALSSVMDLFVNSSNPFDPAESPEARRLEGKRTIQSAYKKSSSYDPERVTTELRQHMIGAGLSAEIRGYEILRANGYAPGDEICFSELKYLYTDYGARLVMSWIKSLALSPRPSPSGAIADSNGVAIDSQSMDCSEKFSTKNKSRGRPRVFVVLPSVADLLNYYGLSHRAAAVVSPENLETKGKYHAAALRELITRIAGQARRGRTWQANIFKVCTATIRAWSAAAGIVGRYIGRALAFFNLKSLPEDETCWIEDETKKRYPALQSIAARLMGEGKRLTWFDRTEGKVYYPSAAALEMSAAAPEKKSEARKYWPAPSYDPGEIEAAPDVQPESKTDTPLQNDPEPRRHYEPVNIFQYREFWAGHDGTEGIRLNGNYSRPAPAGSKRRAHRITKEYESLCYRIQSKLPTLQLKAIETFIKEHGPERVTQALNASVNRSRIKNPSGYFITILERA